jgi:Aspartyl/Asparaginyl beta-hydroxylase
MIALSSLPILDKTALIGGCARLSLRIDAERLRAEVEAIPAELWLSRGGRVGVHDAAQAIFLRGYAPYERNPLPIGDREALARVPYIRTLIHEQIPAAPMRCLLARLPGGGVIKAHCDQTEYFDKTIRIHMPVISNDAAWMFSRGSSYRMLPGEVWALNNSAPHGVWNGDPQAARTHLICDFLSSPGLLDLLAHAERDLGRDEPRVREHLIAAVSQPAA